MFLKNLKSVKVNERNGINEEELFIQIVKMNF